MVLPLFGSALRFIVKCSCQDAFLGLAFWGQTLRERYIFNFVVRGLSVILNELNSFHATTWPLLLGYNWFQLWDIIKMQRIFDVVDFHHTWSIFGTIRLQPVSSMRYNYNANNTWCGWFPPHLKHIWLFAPQLTDLRIKPNFRLF